MSPDEIRAVIEDELGRIAPDITFADIDPKANLRDEADIDSMDFLNLVTALHVRLGVAIPDADAPKLTTIDGAVAYLAARLATKAV